MTDNSNKKTLFQLLKAAWTEWRSESRESKRMKTYSEVISLHSKQTGSFGRADHESGVMQAYFKACKAKEAEVAKNVRAMVFGASPEEKNKLKENLMSLGIDLDSIITEADEADGITNEVMTTGFDEFPKTTDSAGNIVTGKAAEELRAMRAQDAHKANRKDIWPDYSKSVTGNCTSDILHNNGQMSLEETATALLTGAKPIQVIIDDIPQDPKMEEYIAAIHENVIVPSVQSLETLPITVGLAVPTPEFEKPIPVITGEDNPNPRPIHVVDTPLIKERIGEMPLTPSEAHALGNEWAKNIGKDLPEPSSSSESRNDDSTIVSSRPHKVENCA